MRAVTGLMVFYLISIIPGDALSPKEADHVGCFGTSLVKSNRYYEVHYMLTWEECVKFCDNRLTGYAGIQAEHRLSTDNFCYCGNELPEQSTHADNTSCTSCLDQKDRYCGGATTMSVYRLRDSSPFAAMLAVYSSTGVVMYTGDATIAPTLVKYGSVYNVEYVYQEDEIFFKSSSNLYRSFYNYITMKYTSPLSLQTSLVDFAVDWTEYNKTYWTSSSGDIYETNLQSGNILLLDRSYTLSSLAIDPYLRILFFIEQEKSLISYSLKDKTIHHYYNGKTHMTKVYKMAVDVDQQVIYSIGTMDENTTLYLASVDYKDTKMRVLFSGPQLTKAYALDVFNGEVAWVNYNEGIYSLYKCKLSPRCNSENLTIIYQTTNIIYDIKIYHPDRQTPGTKYLCSRISCSHGCVKVSLFVVQCTCPSGMVLGSDNTTCQEQKVRLSTEASLTEESTVTTTNEEKSPEADTSTPTRHKATESPISIQTKHEESTDIWSISGFQIFVAICFLLILVLLSGNLFVFFKSQKQNEELGVTFIKSDLEEHSNEYVKNYNINTNNRLK